MLTTPAPVVRDAEGPVWFAYLVKGDGPRPKDPKELEAMQAAHIGNLQRLFREKKLIAAGPLNDPTTVRRGITVLTVRDHVAIADCFKTDPYVRSGIMHIEAHRWDGDRNQINFHNPDPQKIEENRLVILTSASVPSAELLANHRRHFARLKQGSAAGGGAEKGGYTEFLLFHGADEAKLKSHLDRDPWVRAGAKVEILQLWMGKGSLPDR
jgi:uncharacterized protein YciI